MAYVELTLNTKTLTARMIPISERLTKTLEEMRADAVGSDDDAPIFSFTDIRKSFGAACKDADIVGLRWHDLRATTASRLIGSGLSIEETAKILGHTVLGTTYAHYLRIGSQTVSKAADLLNQFNGWAILADELGEMDLEERAVLIN